MRLEKLGAGYYLTEVYVEEGSNTPTVNDHQYRTLQGELHEPGSGDDAVVFQIDQTFFEILPSRNTPTDTLELPGEALEKTRVINPPVRREVMVPEPWFWRYLKEPNLI